MYRMIYASSATVDVTSAVLNAIAEASQRNNAKEGITGLLLYGDRSFFQVLEGDDDVIYKMKAKIWDDPRHEGISILREAKIDTPSFPEWSMGCYRVDGLDSGSAIWPIMNVESIMDHMPSSAPPEVIVLARTFLTNIAPRGVG